MKVTLESTGKFVTLNGIQCRIWEGKSESGIPCFAFIARIGVDEADVNGCEAFARELVETTKRPGDLSEGLPIRLVV